MKIANDFPTLSTKPGYQQWKRSEYSVHIGTLVGILFWALPLKFLALANNNIYPNLWELRVGNLFLHHRCFSSSMVLPSYLLRI